MVKVRKGTKTLSIPAGSVRKYLSAGWELTKGSRVSRVDTTRNNLKFEEDIQLQDGEYEDDVEYVDPEELAHRPLGELDKEELAILAEYKGIDVSHMSTAKQLRAAIRSLE